MAFTSKPDENPEFALLDQNDPVTGEANVAEPPTTKKNYGWAYLEKPGHNWMNWLHRKTSEWLTYFNQFFSATHQFKINEIIEYDTDAGVTIDGSLIKDGEFKIDTITEKTTGAGVTIDGSLIKDGDIKVDTITEKTASAGVTIDGVELKDNNLTATGNIELDGGISTGANDSIKLAWKVIEIGDWDMDATDSINVAHGLTLGNIRTVNVMIRDDTGSLYNFESVSVGASEVLVQLINATSTNIVLTRDTDGFFDTTAFNSTSYNRGWITICYEI